MAVNSGVPQDFAYTWESVGGEHYCSFCGPRKPYKHAWRAHSDTYGDAYVCPRHLVHIQHGFTGEAGAVWLAIRARNHLL